MTSSTPAHSTLTTAQEELWRGRGRWLYERFALWISVGYLGLWVLPAVAPALQASLYTSSLGFFTVLLATLVRSLAWYLVPCTVLYMLALFCDRHHLTKSYNTRAFFGAVIYILYILLTTPLILPLVDQLAD